MTDNTAQLQDMINAAKGGPVTIPAGLWYVDATVGLVIPSGTQLTIAGSLAALPNGNDWSHIILCNNVEDVSINLTGSIIGEGLVHLNDVGTGHGMGVMFQNSGNVSLSGTGSISHCWGDGVYVIGCTGVSVTGIISDWNRRNGMSVISVDGLTVSNAAFNYQSGTAPQVGIDLEPDTATEFIKAVDIGHCQFVGNTGAGVQFGFGGAPKSNFTNVKVHDCLYKGNKPIAGLDTWYSNLLYATTRWVPGYDWWGVPTEVSI